MDHWNNYLENTDSSTIWTANKYITNEGKAKALAEVFFPPKPTTSSVPQEYSYTDPLPSPPPITEEQIHMHIAKLWPYKAPGPDGIPNIVLQKLANLIVPYLLPI